MLAGVGLGSGGKFEGTSTAGDYDHVLANAHRQTTALTQIGIRHRLKQAHVFSFLSSRSTHQEKRREEEVLEEEDKSNAEKNFM